MLLTPKTTAILAGAVGVVAAEWAATAGAPPPAETEFLFVDDDAPPGGDGLSWDAAFETIADALVVANQRANFGLAYEVRVGQGEYRADEGAGSTPGDQAASLEIGSGVHVVGGFAGVGAPDPDANDPDQFETVITGDLNGDDGPGFVNYADNSVTMVEVPPSASLRGFTLTGGAGSAVVLEGGLIEACLFRHNIDLRDDPSIGGAAILISGADFSSPEFKTTFGVSRCTFFENRAQRYGGAVRMQAEASPFFNCRFLSNRATYGGAIFSDVGAPVCTNCVFAGNEAVSDGTTWAGGGAVYADDTVLMAHCTVYGNRSSGDWGGVFSGNSVALLNTILWANEDATGRTFQAQFGGDWDIAACCIEGAPPDFASPDDQIQCPAPSSFAGPFAGVIADDPLFVDPLGPDGVLGTLDDDYRLSGFSPCIDRGSTDCLKSSNETFDKDYADLDDDGVIDEPIPTDLAGLPREIDDALFDNSDILSGDLAPIDLGAFEYQADCDGNGVTDNLDVVDFGAPDCDDDGVPDACEPQTDCDANGAIDVCDLASGAALDCNGNGVPDSCDIASGVSLDLDGNGTPDECDPLMLFADADAAPGGDGLSWATAFHDLQDALAAAERPGQTEVWVAEGVYRPGPPNGNDGNSVLQLGVYHVFNVPPGTDLRGGFAGGEGSPDQADPAANPTVLSGDLDGNDADEPDIFANRFDNAQNVLSIARLGEGDSVDGFIIEGGRSFAFDGVVFSSDNRYFASAGVRADAVDGAVLSRCIVRDNRCYEDVFQGAGVSVGLGRVTIDGCEFTGNVADGDKGVGTVFVGNGGLTLNDTVMRGNTVEEHPHFGVVRIQQLRHPVTITGCDISNNKASPLRIYLLGGTPPPTGAPILVADTIMAGNDDLPRIIYPAPSTDVTLTGCTVIDNFKPGLQQLLVSTAGPEPVSVRNCVFGDSGGNATPVVFPSGGVDSCYVEGPIDGFGPNTIQGVAGDGVLADRFGPDGVPGSGDEDYAPAAGSVIIDAGDNDAVVGPDDVLGSPRILDGDADGIPVVDLGAIEVVPPTTCAADLNADDVIDTLDLNVVLLGFGCTGVACPGDIDADGDTDADDLNALLTAFGRVCP